MGCGVYTIQLIGTTRCYVGSSKNHTRRFGHHRWNLRRGKHGAALLQRDWNEHGEKMFSFSLIEECAEDILLGREQHWMNMLDCIYNGAKKAFRVSFEGNQKRSRTLKGISRPPHISQAISKALKGQPKTEAHKEANRQAQLSRDPSTFYRGGPTEEQKLRTAATLRKRNGEQATFLTATPEQAIQAYTMDGTLHQIAAAVGMTAGWVNNVRKGKAHRAVTKGLVLGKPGVRVPGRKIAPEWVMKVWNDHRPIKVIAEDLGLTYQTAANVKSGRAWSNVTGAK